MTVSVTYTIRLCKNGREFKCIPNVVDDFRTRRTTGELIDEKWRVLGRIRNTVTEIVLDVEEVAS
jgi:hypothetical protein